MTRLGASTQYEMAKIPWPCDHVSRSDADYLGIPLRIIAVEAVMMARSFAVPCKSTHRCLGEDGARRTRVSTLSLARIRSFEQPACSVSSGRVSLLHVMLDKCR